MLAVCGDQCAHLGRVGVDFLVGPEPGGAAQNHCLVSVGADSDRLANLDNCILLVSHVPTQQRLRHRINLVVMRAVGERAQLLDEGSVPGGFDELDVTVLALGGV